MREDLEEVVVVEAADNGIQCLHSVSVTDCLLRGTAQVVSETTAMAAALIIPQMMPLHFHR